jgi:transposase-like protein
MARRSRRRDSAKEQFWWKVVDGFDAERSTVRAWCLKHGVSEPSFYAWRRELKRRDAILTKDATSSTTTQLLRVKVAPSPALATPGVMIELAEGLRLHVAVDQLTAVLDVLEARRC